MTDLNSDAAGGRTRWWQPAAVLAGAIAVLLCGAALGWTLLHGRVDGHTAVVRLADVAVLRELTEVERQVGELLDRDIGEAQRTLAADQCTAPPLLEAVDMAPTAVAEQVAQATALVFATKPGGTTIGTGFFVAPDRLVTSDRLVDGAADLRVVNQPLGGAKPARVVARSKAHDLGHADFAVLVVDEAQRQPLPLRTEIARDEAVAVAGFLGRASQAADSPADAVLSTGKVGAVRTLASGLPIVGHTIALAAADAGGPLIDRCGRVVGVQAVGYAIAAPALRKFLETHGVPFAAADGPCMPQGAGK